MSDAVKFIKDTNEIKVGDILEYRCPKFGLVTQWGVRSIYMGATNEESVIEVYSLSNLPSGNVLERDVHGSMFIPECLTRNLTIVRVEAEEERTNDQG